MRSATAAPTTRVAGNGHPHPARVSWTRAGLLRPISSPRPERAAPGRFQKRRTAGLARTGRREVMVARGFPRTTIEKRRRGPLPSARCTGRRRPASDPRMRFRAALGSDTYGFVGFDGGLADPRLIRLHRSARQGGRHSFARCEGRVGRPSPRTRLRRDACRGRRCGSPRCRGGFGRTLAPHSVEPRHLPRPTPRFAEREGRVGRPSPRIRLHAVPVKAGTFERQLYSAL